MPKQRHDHYAQELAEQIAAWQRKPALRSVYARWYARIVAELSACRPVVEIGSGCGNFKQFFPEVIATDVIGSGPWIDEIVDAQQLPYHDRSIGNFVLIDCLHHLPQPLRFLKEAERTLLPGGRIILFEPAVTWGSRPFWAVFHHEPIDLSANLIDEQASTPVDPGFTYANMGTACLLFERQRDQVLAQLPELSLVKNEFSDFFAYAATGGFSYYSLLPNFLIGRLHTLEAHCFPRQLWPWIGLRQLTVLEKR